MNRAVGNDFTDDQPSLGQHIPKFIDRVVHDSTRLIQNRGSFLEPSHEILTEVADISAATKLAWALALRIEVRQIPLADYAADVAVYVLSGDDGWQGFEQTG
jgi:hypothetical protein